MTITLPTNAINPGSFKHQWSNNDTFKIASNGRVFPQPDHLKNDVQAYGHEQYIDQFVINKSSSSSITYRSSITFQNEEKKYYHAWAPNAGYLTGWIGNQFTDIYLNHKKESRHQDNESFVKNYNSILQFSSTGSATSLANQFTVAIHFRNITDDIEVGDYFETMPENDGGTYSWTPYDENESCSSYMMMVGAKNVNKIINETKGSHTLMLYQRGTVIE
jgi:hypothetical protein